MRTTLEATKSLEIALLRALANNACKTLVKEIGYDKAIEVSCPQLRSAIISMRNRKEL